MPIFGIAASIASLLLVLIGFPAQIVRNYRRKSCEGLDPTLYWFALVTYTCWGLYGWTKPDIYMKLAQTPGAILTATIIIQFYYYKKRRKT